jgi:hypothetical protein
MQSRSACATSSRSPSGAWRSISTLPAMRRMPRAWAAVNSASTDTLCTVGTPPPTWCRGPAARPGKRRAGRRHRRVGMGALGREGVALQPVQQFGAVAGDDVQLRAVHMGVDEARQQQPAALVIALPARPGRLITGLHAGDAAVVADQQPVVGPPAHVLHRRRAPVGRAGEVQQVGADGLHAASGRAGSVRVGSCRATSRTCSRNQRMAGAWCVRSCHSW